MHCCRSLKMREWRRTAPPLPPTPYTPYPRALQSWRSPVVAWDRARGTSSHWRRSMGTGVHVCACVCVCARKHTKDTISCRPTQSTNPHTHTHSSVAREVQVGVTSVGWGVGLGVGAPGTVGEQVLPPKHTPSQSLSWFATSPVSPPAHTPQSSMLAEPPQRPLQSMLSQHLPQGGVQLCGCGLGCAGVWCSVVWCGCGCGCGAWFKGVVSCGVWCDVV